MIKNLENIIIKILRAIKHYFLILLILLFGITILSVQIFAQNNQYQITRISNEKGLSQSSIYAILQDSQGYLWFGTAEGLNKYDGNYFTVYRFDSYDSTTISDNWVTSIYEDKNNTLWFGTGNEGLNKFERNTNKFIRYKHNDSDINSLSNNNIYSILEDREGNLWIGTEGGLNKFDRIKQTFIRYNNNPSNPQSLSSDDIDCIYEDSEGFLWIGTDDKGLNKFDKAKNIFYRYKYNPHNPSSISNNTVWSVREDPLDNNILWVATFNGLNKFNKKNQKFTRLSHNAQNPNSLIGNSIRSLFIDSKGNFWIGTYGDGLDKYNANENLFSHFKWERNNINTISKNLILSIYEDKAGNIWIGTRGGGLSKLKKNKFDQFNFYESKIDEINTNNVWSVLKDSEGRVWVGTDNGLLLLNRSNGHYTLFQNNPNDPESISDNTISAMCEDKNKTLWFGTQNNGLNKFDSKTKRFTSYKNNPADPKSLPYDNVKSIFEDSEGIMWIGTRGGGFAKFDRIKGTFKTYQNTPDPNSLSNDRVNYIFEDSKQELWICTSGGGVNNFNKKTGKFTHYTFDPKDPNSLTDIYVLSGSEDKDGNLWFCTYDGGINLLERTSWKFYHLNKENGLPNNVTYGALFDDSGNLWISTNSGISKFNPHTQTFRNYDDQDGLQSKEFNSGAFFKSKDGEMFFGGINGFNSFYPKDIVDNNYNPPIIISGFKIFDKSISNNKVISDIKEIYLSYKDNYFSFEFSSLDFSAPEKNQYAYKLEGFDMEWNKCGNRRYASYTNLDAGKYTFKVKGTNSDGVWNENFSEINIIISPPFWRTWWFRISFLFIAIYLFVFVYKRRVRFLKTHNEFLKKEINERMKVEKELIKAKEKAEESDRLKSNFLAQMSHEIRTPINTILSFTSLLKEEMDRKVEDDLKESFTIIENGGRRLIRTIDMILKMSEIQAGRFEINLEEFDIISDVLNTLIKELKFIAGRKNIKLNVNNNASNTKIIADKYTVTQIFQNLIDNAIKYTEKGSVSVVIYNNGYNQLYVEVIDTGIGMSVEYLNKLFVPFSQEEGGYTRRFEGTGLGLSLVKNYVDINKASIEIASEKWKGTKVILKFNNSISGE